MKNPRGKFGGWTLGKYETYQRIRSEQSDNARNGEVESRVLTPEEAKRISAGRKRKSSSPFTRDEDS